ncbi:MAG: hypothetical protein GEU73_03510 [Chloroflexi bacterium]|nr:hypothetical protein [Chloroflexota bacterium]
MRGIAARLVGDAERWDEIFELNRGSARLADGRTLTNPDLIWPGLRLRIPGAAAGWLAPQRAAPEERAEAVTAAPMPMEPASMEPSASAQAEGVEAVGGHTPAGTEVGDPLDVGQPARNPLVPPHVSIQPAAPAEQMVPSPLVYGAAGVAAAGVVVGGAALLKRRRIRRSLGEPPIPRDPGVRPPARGFADAEPDRVLAHRVHAGEGELGALAAETLSSFGTARPDRAGRLSITIYHWSLEGSTTSRPMPSRHL